MQQGLTPLAPAQTRPTAQRVWGLSAIVALACIVGFAANAFGLQSWLLLAALYFAALAQPHQITTAVARPQFLILLAFSILYWLASTESWAGIFPTFSYPVAYLVGFLLVAGPKDEGGRFTTVITAGVVGSTLHGVLNAATNYATFGWSLPGRVLPDFWTGAPLTATLQGALFIPLVGFAFYALTSRSGHRAIRAGLTLLALALAIGYNLATASRTLFVVGALTFGLCLLAALRTRPGQAVVLALSGGVAFLLYTRNVLLIRSAVEDSALSRRMSETDATTLGDDPRLARWGYIIDNFWDHTAGGQQSRAVNGYAHNLWLDAYDVAGLLPLILLLWFSAATLALLVKVIRSPLIESPLKFLVGGLWVALLAQFMTEPILDGVPYLFALFCLMVGAADGLIRSVPVTRVSVRPPALTA